jgi:hypothetical protein
MVVFSLVAMVIRTPGRGSARLRDGLGVAPGLAIAATALTPAATRQAALKPWKNALEAAAWTAFASAGWPLTLVRLASASAPPTESWAVRASRGASSAGSLSLSRLL